MKSLEEMQKDYILKVIEYHYGNLSQSAKVLKVSIKTLYNKLYRWGVDHRNFYPKSKKEKIKLDENLPTGI